MLYMQQREPITMSATLASLVLILFSATSAFASDNLALSPKQIQALGISTAPLPAQSTGVLAGIPAQVVIPGNQLFIVSTPLPAMVEQTLVGIGDPVHKGQLLARLQSPALAEAQRGFLQASTQEQLARGNFARDEQLWKDGIIAESRYRSAQSLFIEASAALAEKRQMLVLAGLSKDAIARLQSGENLNSLLLITSPIDGVILEKSASAGQRLDSATPLFNVARLQPLGLEIQAPLVFTRDLRVGAAVTIPAFAAQGKITAIGQSLSGSNQTILLRALINKGTQNLRPGQHVEVSIATAAVKSAQWNVPNAAIARVAGKSMIFVETATGFQATPVTVLHEGAQQTLISGKLGGKEKIVVSGVAVLKAKLMGIGGGE
jgi:RND family efflux transporter MFP subunit